MHRHLVILVVCAGVSAGCGGGQSEQAEEAATMKSAAPNRVQPECPVGRTNGPTELPFRETRDVLDEPVADPLGDRVRAIPRAQAVLDLGDDRLDGALGVAESVRDLLRIGAAREHSQHFEATVVEVMRHRQRCIARLHAQPGGGRAHRRDQLLRGQRAAGEEADDRVRLVRARMRAPVGAAHDEWAGEPASTTDRVIDVDRVATAAMTPPRPAPARSGRPLRAPGH